MISIRQRGVPQAAVDLRTLASRLDGSTVVFSEVLDEVLELQGEFWNSNGRGTWAPDQPSTTARDRRGGLDTELMRSTGALERASTRLGAPGQTVETTAEEIVFTVDLPYALPLAEKGRSAVLEATARDADRLAERYLHALLDG